MLASNVDQNDDLVSITEASAWASNFLKKKVTNSNISYLIQYALIKKYVKDNSLKVSLCELRQYYSKYKNEQFKAWNNTDINQTLSFSNLKESETTKHVHRLHPYKGKFIPQLVEYFLDSHIDNFKNSVYFKKGDIILDPFCGSGTTLVQANELGMHAIGIEISIFNTLISNCKISDIDINELKRKIEKISELLYIHLTKTRIQYFENELLDELNKFNHQFFSSYDYKISIKNKIINEEIYSKEKESLFLDVYYKLIKKYKININCDNSSFINKWFLPNIRDELYITRDYIESDKDINQNLKNILILILSRTMRSCRATTHSDLATLLNPVTTTYYCTKHYKICKPLFSILKWWNTYSKDTTKRILEFNQIKTQTYQICLTGDSRNIDLYKCLSIKNRALYDLLKNKKFSGIFSSPPYVGLIDYHEQHAYTYELFNFERKDNLEIGSLDSGQNIRARDMYVDGITTVLLNCKRYLREDYNIFLVANDKYNLYPKIAEKSNMVIVNQYNRPVLNRTEKVKNAYAETIFHLKEK